MRALAILMAAIALAGCAARTVDPPDVASPPTAPAFPTPEVERPPGSPVPVVVSASDPPVPAVATWTFDPSPWGEGEAYVATHPTDPRVAAVAFQAWRDEGESGWRVFCAVTADRGATWRVSNMSGVRPVLPVGPADEHQFDASVAIGRDGAIHVLFGDGARGPAKAPLDFPIALATSRDLGESWTTRALPSTGMDLAWDYMNVAAARDSDLVVAVANVVGAGPWFWRSTDAGATWAEPTPLRASSAVVPVPLIAIPNVQVGLDGLVVVTVRASGGFYATTSKDGGESFSAWSLALADAEGGSIGRGLVVHGGSSDPITLFATAGARVIAATSTDGGGAFEAARDVAKLPHEARWIAASAGGGRTFVLGTFSEANDRGWGAALDLVDGDGGAARLVLAAPGDAGAPRGGNAGDDYGGIAVAADGAVWAAWSDPRDGEPRIGVARWDDAR